MSQATHFVDQLFDTEGTGAASGSAQEQAGNGSTSAPYEFRITDVPTWDEIHGPVDSWDTIDYQMILEDFKKSNNEIKKICKTLDKFLQNNPNLSEEGCMFIDKILTILETPSSQLHR